MHDEVSGAATSAMTRNSGKTYRGGAAIIFDTTS